MAKGNFEIEVPIKIKDAGSSKAGEQLAKDFAGNLKKSVGSLGFGGGDKTDGIGMNIGKIAASVGIVASIWQGIAPLMRPVLKMFNILLTLLLIPLMPLIKKMVQGLAKTAKNVSTAQTDAGGGYAGFIAGLAEVMKSPTIWAMAGVGLAMAFVASIGSGALVGALALSLGLMMILDELSQSEIEAKVVGAGLAGIATGIAVAIATGNPILGTLAGILTYSLASKLEFTEGLTKKDIENALLGAGIATAAVGALALIFLGLGPAVIIGSLTFAIALLFDLTRKKDPFKDLIEKEYSPYEMGMTRQFTGGKMTGELQSQIDNISWQSVIDDMNKTESTFIKTNSTMSTGIQTLNISVEDLGKMIGSPVVGSYPLVYALKQAENEWITMSDVSINAINKVISNLNRIPRTITTTHYIRTVRI